MGSMAVKPTDHISLSIVGKAIPASEGRDDASQRAGGDSADRFETESSPVGVPEISIPASRPSVERFPDASGERPAGSGALLRRASPVRVESGSTWSSALGAHYGQDLPETLVARIAAAHQSESATPPPRTILAPGLGDLYRDRYHPGALAESKIIERADIVIPVPGQTTVDAVADHYEGVADLGGAVPGPDFLRSASAAVNLLNGRSRYCGPPVLLALPNVDDLMTLMERLRSDVVRMRVRDLDVEGGAGSEVARAGELYSPESGERLGDVAAYVYRDHLTEPGMAPEHAERELQEILLAVMRWNRLATLDVSQLPEMYWPTVEQLSAFRAEPRVQVEAMRFKRNAPVLWGAIVASSTDARARAVAAKDLKVERGMSPDARLEGIERALESLVAMQLKTLQDPDDVVDMAYIESLGGEEIFEGDEVYAGVLSARKMDESMEAYAQRLFDGTLQPCELQEFVERPEFLVATHLGLTNRNGDFEPGQRESLIAGLERLALVDEGGKLLAGGESADVTIDQKTVAILNEVLHLDLERVEDEPMDAFLERAYSYTYGDAEMDIIKHLWLWNLMAKGGVASVDEMHQAMVARDEYRFVFDGFFLSADDEVLIGTLMSSDTSAGGSSGENDAVSPGHAEARRILLKTRRRLIRLGVRLDAMSERQERLFRDSFMKMLTHLQSGEAQEDEFHEKILIAGRLMANRILEGEAPGGPDSWFV
jgi:hypothetical protein